MFGRKKMYKRGLADAMQAYEAFGKKQEEALAFVREEVRSGNKELKDALAGLGENLNGIYQYLNAQEKAALYQLSTPMDIKELDDEEKRLLLAVLYQLADNESSALTDDQQAYIRSVQKYLEITNPQTFADLSAIEQIDSIDVQKTFLRVVLEFFYLQDGDELSDEQEEIFDYFSVNKKQATIVENEVSRLFNAVGPEGVAEKYGYVPEEAPTENTVTEEPNTSPAEYAPQAGHAPDSSESFDNSESLDISEFEEITISSAMHIPAGTTQSFDHKIIHVQAPINCEGSLEFRSCVIHCREIEWAIKIELKKTASLTMRQCTIENHACSEEAFIDADGFRSWEDDRSSAIEFQNCEFINCWCFLKTQERPVQMEHCRALNAGYYFIKTFSDVSISHCEFIYEKEPAFYPAKPEKGPFAFFRFGSHSVLNTGVLKMDECKVVGTLWLNDPSADFAQAGFYSDIRYFCDYDSYESKSEITNSTFFGCACLFDDNSDTLMIQQSKFLHCGKIFFDSAVELRECRFDNCSQIGHSMKKSTILYCQFNTCFNQLFSADETGGMSFQNCEFNNWQASNKARPDDNNTCSGTLDMLHFKRKDKDADSSEVVNCSFNGMVANDCFIISAYQLSRLKYGYAAYVKACRFDNCTTKRESGKIIKEYLIPYFKFRKANEPERGIGLTNCSGLDRVNTSSGTAENIIPKTKASTGQPIGASVEVENVGVPGYTSPRP